MAVNLFDLVDALRWEVNPPGTDLFPDATEDDWGGALSNAFWEVRLYGFLSGFEENAAARGGWPTFVEGMVTPIDVIDDTYDDPIGYSTTQDLSRELQQLIILWAAYKIVLNRMGSLNTVFRTKAGPVEYETQQAATVLKTVLDALKGRIDLVLETLPTPGAGAVVFDAMIERSYSQAVGETWWVNY
jgi:hypothetical protein